MHLVNQVFKQCRAVSRPVSVKLLRNRIEDFPEFHAGIPPDLLFAGSHDSISRENFQNEFPGKSSGKFIGRREDPWGNAGE